MPVIRVNKTKDYTVMSNYHLRDKNLSLKSKGLLSVILSLPDDWEYSIEGLVSICVENETAIKSALNELKKYGYLVVNKLLPNQTKSKKIEYVYNVYEKPIGNNQEVENQEVENQGVGFLGVGFLGVENQEVENQGQLNTNILNTKELNTNESNKEEEKVLPKGNTHREIQRKNTSHVYYPDELLNNAFLEFIKMRVKIKKPLTDRAIELCMKKLEELSTPEYSDSMDNDLAIKILEQSIMNCWQGVFPLKEERKTEKTELDKWRDAL